MKEKNRIEVLAELLEKLNNTSDIFTTVSEVIRTVCEYLDYGCGFYYKLSYSGDFELMDAETFYDNTDIPEKIPIKTIIPYTNSDSYEILKIVTFKEGNAHTPLEKKFSQIFNAKSLLICPIVDEKKNPIGFVGVSDRRGTARTGPEDKTFAYTIIRTICNYIKIQIIQDEVKSTRKALQSVTDNMGVDIYVNDFKTHEILYANKSMAEPYGSVDDMIGQKCWQFLYDDKTEQCEYCPQKKIIDEEGNPTKVYSWDYQRPFDGKWFKVLSAAFNWIDGRLAHIVSSVDITESKKNEQIIKRMAMYDRLTDLPNRGNMTDTLEEMVMNMNRTRQEGYVIFFDLDGFKSINDTYGHQTGDDFLIAISKMLQRNPLTKNKCYRYGGDEFVVLLENSDEKEKNKVLKTLENMFLKLIKVGERELECGVSIGLSHYPNDGNEASDLIRIADMKMYQRKIDNRRSRKAGR